MGYRLDCVVELLLRSRRAAVSRSLSESTAFVPTARESPPPPNKDGSSDMSSGLCENKSPDGGVGVVGVSNGSAPSVLSRDPVPLLSPLLFLVKKPVERVGAVGASGSSFVRCGTRTDWDDCDWVGCAYRGFVGEAGAWTVLLLSEEACPLCPCIYTGGGGMVGTEEVGGYWYDGIPILESALPLDGAAAGRTALYVAPLVSALPGGTYECTRSCESNLIAVGLGLFVDEKDEARSADSLLGLRRDTADGTGASYS